MANTTTASETMHQTATNAVVVAIRTKAGSSATRAVRYRGMVPAILYGGSVMPELLELDPRAILKPLHKGVIKAMLFTLDFGNGKKIDAVVRDYQLNLLNELPTHLDFQRVVGDESIAIMVPVRFLNVDICPGVKAGGILTLVESEVELYCRPRSIPTHINVDLKDFKIGTAIKLSHFQLPEGVQPVIKKDFTVATIAIPKGMDVDADIAAEQATAAATAVDATQPAPAAGATTTGATAPATPAADAGKPAADAKK